VRMRIRSMIWGLGAGATWWLVEAVLGRAVGGFVQARVATDGPRGRSETAVQLVDVLPTVLAATGAAVPPGLQGEALPHVTHPSFAEEDIDPFLVARYGARYDRSIRVLYDGTYKLIRTSRGEGMLFDLARDPAELHDLAAAEPERAADLQRRLDTALGTLVARN